MYLPGPRPHARQRLERRDSRPGERRDRRASRRRHSEAGRVGLDQSPGQRKQTREPQRGVIFAVDRLAMDRGKAPGEFDGRRDTDLLAEDRADSKFERVPGAWHTQAWPHHHARPEARIGAEMSGDRGRVGAEIEQPPQALGGGVQRWVGVRRRPSPNSAGGPRSGRG